MKKGDKKYTKGMRDVERVLEHVDDEAKQEARARIIKQLYKQGKAPNKKEEVDESPSQS